MNDKRDLFKINIDFNRSLLSFNRLFLFIKGNIHTKFMNIMKRLPLIQICVKLI